MSIFFKQVILQYEYEIKTPKDYKLCINGQHTYFSLNGNKIPLLIIFLVETVTMSFPKQTSYNDNKELSAGYETKGFTIFSNKPSTNILLTEVSEYI